MPDHSRGNNWYVAECHGTRLDVWMVVERRMLERGDTEAENDFKSHGDAKVAEKIPVPCTGGEVSWKSVGTSWVNCRLWITLPAMYPPITFGVHLECNLNI